MDETNNPKELKFYWKGIAYDDQFSLIDRLQKLYQEGMQKFLDEDVVYISADQIDSAFEFFKNDPDATKDKIKQYFKELKFFNNNDFGFIDVHNKKLFYQNTAVLLKIVQMLQDIRLKSDSDSKEEHQFLGDMFEGFLDQGVKQSEGQFFTPMPIVKFILKSLPLESIITKADEIPKVIDYACGAGHFLNEYAKEIKSIVEQGKEAKITDFYENVYGVEKEYRLSKVAKVSSFMYGQDDINIVYSDALSSGKTMEDRNIKDNSFSILVANPPYSVKGFLETLTEAERKKYELIKTVAERSFPNNNSIETFFIERAKQLLKPGGVAGIIVPSSILTKGKTKSTSKSTNIYVATREILLKYFDIVAIAEFGSGTFGKTGTNTVTLFIRRKKENPAPADHFKNRVNAWFKYDKSKDGLFEDENLLKHYCTHLELNFEDYQTLLKEKPNEELLQTDVFREYQKEFDKWSEIKNLKKKTTFKSLTVDRKEAELKKRFIAYLIENEKEKLYYFVLASQNPRKVLIIKSPTKTAKMKEFLGYEWSAAKGNEGIKYLGNAKLDKLEGEDEDEGNVALEEEDKRVLSNIFNLNNINTPLYDPHNKKNEEKINYLINQNYKGEDFEIPDILSENVLSVGLHDMLDLSRADFNKSLSLSPQKKITIESKWELAKLGDVTQIQSGGTPDTNNPSFWEGGNINWATLVDTKKKYLFETKKKITKEGLDNSSAKLLPINTVIFSSRATIGEVCINKKPTATNQGYKNFLCNPKKINYEYLYYVLKCYRKEIESIVPPGTKYKEINSTDIRNFEIPLPPLEIQMKIVSACSNIDKEAEKAEKTIVYSMNKIEELFQEGYVKSSSSHRISNTDIFKLSIGKRVLKNEINLEKKGIPVYSANVFEPFGHIEKKLLKDFDTPSVLWGIDGDWMVNCLPENEPFYPTDHCGVLKIISDELQPKYVAWAIRKEGERVRFSRTNRASMDSMRGLSVKAPSKEIQTALIKKVENLEKKIKTSKEVITGISERQEVVIKSYLMGEVSEPILAMAADPGEKYKKK